MSKETFFSIISPVYNAESTIFRSITSVLNQNYNNFELIIINDASTDKTSKICKKFKNNKNIKFLNNRKNLGVSKSLMFWFARFKKDK
ncbi:MAG: glycosyltransferase family 2 protein [Pelagibacteraceae bacterium]|nr:glycosyltransferase family 2 protein [Pelagibacteraceae bacterium]